MLGRLVNRD